jgi:2-polyprenyl-3-methyl-5-hydroxy-6-metoxy-1,4-benzoquinol methylase
MRKAVVVGLALLAQGTLFAAMKPLTYSELTQRMRLFQESRLLLTAVELDVFTAVGKGATGREVAARLKTNPRATETLLNGLVALGALTKQDGRFGTTEELARYLVAGSPEYARESLMHSVHMWGAWGGLTESVRTGTAAIRPGISGDDEQWTEAFIAAMHRNAASAAEGLVRQVGAENVGRLLDIGGGSGAYSIAFAKANAALRAEVLDLGKVVGIAQKHIAEAGLSGRVVTRVGDLTKDEFGSNYDLVLLSAICHMLSPEENQSLFRRCARALVPGGRVVVRDFILEEDKSAPAPAALFAVHMLVNTPGGSTYSEEEYRSWLEGAGFKEVKRLTPTGDLIVAWR